MAKGTPTTNVTKSTASNKGAKKHNPPKSSAVTPASKVSSATMKSLRTKPTSNEHSSFVKGTDQAVLAADLGAKYIIRHIPGATCCDSPYGDVADWPILTNYLIDEDADDEEGKREQSLAVIGGVWLADGGKFVAFWAADSNDDDHVYFLCQEGLEEDTVLQELSGRLCTEICPEMIDVFDDGSGKDRDPTPVPASVLAHPLLSALYL